MKNENVRDGRPVILRKKRHQLALDLNWILLTREAEPDAEAPDVRIDNYAFVPMKCVSEYHVGRLAPDAGQLDELVHRGGHLAVVALYQCLAQADEALCLVTEEPRAPNDLLE